MGNKSKTKEGPIARVDVHRLLQSVGCFVMDMPQNNPARGVWRDRVTRLTTSLRQIPDTDVPDIFSEAVNLLGQLAANSVLDCGWLSVAVNPDHKTVYVHGPKGKETNAKKARVCIQ